MSIEQKRRLLFLLGCLPARLFLVYLAYTLSLTYLHYLGYLALVPATGFTLIYLMDWRKTGNETFGQPIWWNHLRPVHALFYFLFAQSAIRGEKKTSYLYLVADVLVGLAAFVWFHFIQ